MYIKKIAYPLFVFMIVLANLNANTFTKEATVKPVLVQKGDEKHWCPVCGMNLKMFYKTSHTSKLHNHNERQYCSLRCLAVDMQEYDIDTNEIKVVDASTQKLVDANKAYYVIGSKIQGTMTEVSKLAFEKEIEAKLFIKEYGGKIVDFKTALKMAKDSLESDIAMVQKKKEKKIYPMGENIFTKKCSKDIDLNNYIEINGLKSDLKNKALCGAINEKQLQAVALYLWEVKRFGDIKKIDGIIEVTHDEKCPVCGMFVYKYPRWAAQIFYEKHHHSFDGVKDLMKYYFEHKAGISKILVTDYYSQKAIEAKDAYFVIGSDIYGPMGNELIPFKNESDAKTFLIDHKGKKITKFNDILKEEVYKLDE